MVRLRHPRDLVDVAALVFGVSADEIRGTDRSQPTVFYRQAAMWVSKNLLPYGCRAIGRAFGDRDHTTVMHALVRAEQSPFIGELIEDLLEYIEGQP